MTALTMKLTMTEAQVREACQDWARKQVPGWRPSATNATALIITERRSGPSEDLDGHDVRAEVSMTQGGGP